MAIKTSLFILVLTLVCTLSTQGAFAGEHPSATPGGLPQGHPDIANMEMPGGHTGAPSFEVEVLEFPTFQVAVMEGTLGGDIEALFYSMFDAVEAQGLFNAETNVGAVFPFAMKSGWDMDTVMLVGVNLPENAEVTDPLVVFDIPGGEYLMLKHVGPYEETEASWVSAFAWAGEHGIEFGEGPAFERYLDNPEEVAPEKLRTEIYIPLESGQGHAGMDYSQHSGHAGHGAGHGAMAPAHGMPPFNVDKIELAESFQVAYLEGTMGGDLHALFMGMAEEAMNQGLFTDETHVGAIYPTLMSAGYQGDATVVYASFSLPGEFDVAEPFKLFMVPAGEYLFVEHIGPYEDLGSTWEAAFEWAEGHGIQFGDGPAFEHYANDPSNTPAEELVTEIMIPLLPGQKHPEGFEAAGHGSHHGAEHPSGGAEHPTGGGGSEHPH